MVLPLLPQDCSPARITPEECHTWISDMKINHLEAVDFGAPFMGCIVI